MIHPIPDAALLQHIAILGKTRSGKSSVARGLVERLLDLERPVCIIDPKGDWWGIKLARDGKRAGYPVVIFGGEHADVPINAHAGAHVAELFATGNRPCLIDLGGWMVGDRTRFWVEFASTLFRHTKGMRWLVVDECHNFAPKGKVMDPDSGKALHWMNRLASEGLGKGVPMIFASQRPQKVHNDTLTSAETLIAMRVLHPSDRGAVSDWIKGCGDLEVGAKVLGSLAEMKRGEGWAWSPEIDFGPVRVQFPLFKTYDSFRPQTAEDAKGLKGWAEVDLDDVRAKLATVVKEAEANDPAKLKARIRELEKQAAAAPAETKVDERAMQRAVAAAQEAAHAQGYAEGYPAGIALAREHLDMAYAALQRDLEFKLKNAPRPKPAQNIPRNIPAPASARPIKHSRQSAEKTKSAGDGSVSGLQKRILDALAWLDDKGIEPASREATAAVAGVKAGGGYYTNSLGALRTANLVDYPSPGMVCLTEEGRALATVVDDGSELHEKWLGILSGLERQILSTLIEKHPEELSRETLGEMLSKEPGGGYFTNTLGRLRTLGAIDYPQPGYVALTRAVMP